MARGDRLRVERRLSGSAVGYMHHGIDLGDGTVVHARPDDFGNPLGGGRVERTGRAEFAGDGPVLVTTEPPARFPPEEIAARALRQVGRPGYCPLVENCEHFATWCATGQSASRQVDIVFDRLRGAALRLVAAASARGATATAAKALALRSARTGLRGLVPAAIAGEATALAVEWTAHHAGRSAAESRRAGDTAGLAASAAACALAGLAAGPGGVVAGLCAGAAAWAGAGLAARRLRREPGEFFDP
jgi:hypothetical protein